MNQLEQLREQCPYCDGSGDVHSPDGEWRGQCTCEAGLALEISYLRKENEELKESLRYVLDMHDGTVVMYGAFNITTDEMNLARERAK